MSQKQVENNVRFYTMARTKLGDSPEDIHKDLTAVMTESVPDYCTVAKWSQEQSLSPQPAKICSMKNHLILLKVFSFLSISELNSMSRVCQQWLRTATETKEQRKFLPNPKLNLFRFSSGWQFQLGQNGITDLHIDRADFVRQLKEPLADLYTEPACFIYFLVNDYFVHTKCLLKSKPNDVQRDPELHPEIARRMNVGQVANAICGLLPPKSLKLVVAIDSFVFADMSHYKGNKFDEPKCPFDNLIISPNSKTSQKIEPSDPPIASLTLPRSAHFRFNVKQLVSETHLLESINTEADLYQFFGVKADETLRLVWILSLDFFSETASPMNAFLAFLDRMKSRTGQKNLLGDLVVIGNSCNDAFASTKDRNYQYINEEITFVTLICKREQAERVKLAQMVIAETEGDYSDEYEDESSDEDEEAEVDNKALAKDKLTCFANSWSDAIGTREKSGGKGQTFGIFNYMEASQVGECQQCQRGFPEVPIFGYKGYEIIGHDQFPTEQQPRQPAAARIPRPGQMVDSSSVRLYKSSRFLASALTIISLE